MDEQKFERGIIIFNSILLAYFCISVEPEISKLRILAGLLLVISIVGFIFFKYLRRILTGFHMSLFGLVLISWILQGLAFFPGLIPMALRNYLEKGDIKAIRQQTVEYLDHSPYCKFKADTVITSQGDRGTPKQFAYQWKTDKLGFKNDPSVLENGGIEIVALGDSFTEGMGVSVEDAWPSLLNKAGRKTYNFGVQGYAPIQMEGTLRNYGRDLKPRYVIIGYVPGIYERQLIFKDEKSVIAERRCVGGIDSIMDVEIRNRSKYVIVAVYLWSRRDAPKMFDRFRQKLSSIGKRGKSNVLFSKYSAELLAVKEKKFTTDSIESSEAFKKTLESFVNVKKMAEGSGSKVILLYLPFREHVYYEKAMGEPLPPDNLPKIESELFKKFCDREGILFLNLSDKFIEYVNGLKEDTDISLYPYLEIDGHPSPRGHQLIAEDVLSNLIKVQ